MTSSAAPQHLPPLALYVHIPWCVRKCPYCDFNSHKTPQNGLPFDDYLEAIIDDLERDKDMAQGRTISSIFIGGGTPSLMPNAGIAEIIERSHQIVGIQKGAEITMEANPGTVEHHDFAELLTAGVTRLSLGVQSFAREQLIKLGRIHRAEEAKSAVKRAQDAGFERINLDLMHGLPDQDLESACLDLKTAFALNPSHISWYQLTIEKNTEFFSRPPTLPSEEVLADIYDSGSRLLENNGYQQYEVSAYARDGQVSTHNLNYWQFGDYLAVGAGAHGKITDLVNKKIMRYHKTRAPDHYLDRKKPYTAHKTTVSADTLPLEFMMNALRLSAGFDLALYEHRTGLTLDGIDETLRKLERQGLITLNKHRLVPTLLGRRFLNTILDAFF